jgi:hypothetical protein
MRLKPNKCTGFDKIPAKVLRLSADIIAPSITYIFNLSLDTGICVDEWKRAQVITIYKSEDRRKCENYRPIYILPIVSKVFEREVFRQLYGYLSDRVQQCLINGQLSSPKTITCGVLQGSIMGPLLFLLYINDMPDSLSYSVSSLYADDTEIYASSNNCDDHVDKVNFDIQNIHKWMIENKLQTHSNKSKHMFIG